MPDEVVRGLQDLLKTMDGLHLSKRRTLIVRALRKGAEPIRQRAADLAPDDPETPGSRVAESMSVTVSDQTADGAVARIGPTKHGFVGIFAELGTIHQAATPFLQPAFDEKQNEAFQLVGEILGDEIEKAFRGSALPTAEWPIKPTE